MPSGRTGSLQVANRTDQALTYIHQPRSIGQANKGSAQPTPMQSFRHSALTGIVPALIGARGFAAAGQCVRDPAIRTDLPAAKYDPAT
jgi:hypothetical protein